MLDWSKATTFNLDEFVGLHPDAPGWYRRFMQEHLFRHTNLDPRRINFLSRHAPIRTRSALRYERAIAEAGGIDIQILGIGTNGHIGFNEPGAVLDARTHRVKLRPETRRSNAALFGGDIDSGPGRGAVDGNGDDSSGASVVLLAHGESKAGCIARVVNGPDTELPASFLQLHRRRGPDPRRGSRRPARALGRGGLGLQELAEPRLDILADRIAHESSAFLSRLSACGSVKLAFCITIAAFTFHFARRSSASAAS